jgi:hypothetical protein
LSPNELGILLKSSLMDLVGELLDINYITIGVANRHVLGHPTSQLFIQQLQLLVL